MADDFADLKRLEAERLPPPSTLYKYVAPERVDVLEKARIRFTPPLNTNDIFEVRQTFDLVMGPKMQAYFKLMSQEVDFDETFQQVVDESPLSFLSIEEAKRLILRFGGGDVEVLTRGLLDQFLDNMPERMNAPENVDRLLDRIASDQFLLSLSDRADSSPLWAHYAANSTGFVIAFDTSSTFFRRGELGELQGLHKVQYFDGRVSEIMDNPYAALISKQKDWEYEHEWRLYVRAGAVSKTLKVDDVDVHLVEFPREAVQRVILGTRGTNELGAQLKYLLDEHYPGVALTRARADRTTATLSESSVLN